MKNLWMTKLSTVARIYCSLLMKLIDKNDSIVRSFFWKKDPFIEATFQNWRPNEPNNVGTGGEDCVYAYAKHPEAHR